MSVQGLCGICQSAQATDRCEQCGTMVCREHVDTEVGYCVDCAQSVGGGQGGDTHQL